MNGVPYKANMLIFRPEKLARDVKMNTNRSWFRNVDNVPNIDVWVSFLTADLDRVGAGDSSDHKMLTP